MNFGDLEFDFKVSRKTIPGIVQETCEVIWNVLQPLEMPEPNKEMWLKKSAEFYKFINFPNCVGSVGGKHIRMHCQPNTGSDYFNFKKYFSVVLMAVADANYYFTAIDVGSYGREGDSYVFKKSNFWKRFTAGQLDLPGDKPLPSDDSREGNPVSHVLLGDEAFGLSKQLLQPYPSTNLSHEKRIYTAATPEPDVYLWNSEQQTACSTFSHSCASKLCVHHSTVLLCFAHLVRKRDGFVFEDILSCELQGVRESAGVGGRSQGIEVREMFCEYFNGPGALPCQNKRVRMGTN
jgi:hypothetical protein